MTRGWTKCWSVEVTKQGLEVIILIKVLPFREPTSVTGKMRTWPLSKAQMRVAMFKGLYLVKLFTQIKAVSIPEGAKSTHMEKSLSFNVFKP